VDSCTAAKAPVGGRAFNRTPPVQIGKDIGKRMDKPAETEAEHFMP
jgi:hypothetical protein